MKNAKKLFLLLQMSIMATALVTGNTLVGGLSEEKQPSENDPLQKEVIPQISSDIRTQVAARLSSGTGGSGESDSSSLQDAPITVLSYKTQVVAGTNYFVKARIGKFIFLLRIYEDLHGKPELTSVQGPTKESDPIEYF